MKRRAISFLTALVLCLSLCPVRVLATDVVDPGPKGEYSIGKDTPAEETKIIKDPIKFDTKGYTYTVNGATAVSVQGSGRLYLTTGTIQSTSGAGIEVQAGCLLRVEDPGMTVIGATYGLDIASGAIILLSGGTFKGEQGAIRLQGTGADYSALLASTDDIHYAYFNGADEPVQLFEASGNQITANVTQETTLVVKECRDHVYVYRPNPDNPDNLTTLTHIGTCMFCGTEAAPEECKFSFDINGHAKCDKCSHTIQVNITAPSGDPVYNGGPQPDDDDVTVEVKLDGATLDKGTHYEVECTPGTNACEEITVKVTGKTWTFTKTFSVTQARPTITWQPADSVTVDYSGKPVEEDENWPSVKITAATDEDERTLQSLLYYSYKEYKEGEEVSDADDNTGFTDVLPPNTLPTDAGTYLIKANLPETANYKEASSGTIKLTIKPIDPIIAPPEAAKNLVYTGDNLKLVAPGTGTVWNGAVILYALSEDGKAPADSAYSKDIPTGINAGEYSVWYKVEGTNNYKEVEATEIKSDDSTITKSVKIARKPIDPVVELDSPSHLYTGGEIRPVVTVRDPYDWKELPTSEYTVEYINNVNVGGPKDKDEAEDEGEDEDDAAALADTDDDKDEVPTVIVKDTGGGNYEFKSNPISVPFTITPKDQTGLTITNRPGTVTYGDVFTLETSGGSGNGTVKWEIIAAKDADGNDVESYTTIAEISDGGQVTVTGVGTVTVQATKAGDDYKEATATWTFTSGKRHVTATVTAASKTYDGTDAATVKAVVEEGVAFDDEIVITGPDSNDPSGTDPSDDDQTSADLSGTFSDANVGTGKTVTVDTDKAKITVTVNGTEEVACAEEKKYVTENYVITIPGMTTADITKAVTKIETAPEKATPTYIKDTAQELLSKGAEAGFTTTVDDSVDDPTVEYSLGKDGAYFTDISKITATNAGDYDVWYRVKGTDNYFGTTAEKIVVTISPKAVTPDITLTPDEFVYDGSEKKPDVKVEYTENGRTEEIPSSEYTVTYRNNIEVGEPADGDAAPTVVITDKPGGNYEVSGSITFTIKKADAGLTGSPQAVPGLTYNGKLQNLVTVGTANGGHLEYALANGYDEDGTPIPNTGSTSTPPTEYKTEIPKGKDAGEYIVYYKVVGDDNHNDVEAVDIVYVTIQPKTVSSPDIELNLTADDDYADYTGVYNGTPQKPKVTSVKDGETDLTGEYTVSYSNNVNAGTATVHIVDKAGGNYIVNGSKTFEITKATAKFETGKEPQAALNLTYTGKAQTLITAGVPDGGTAVYALDDKNGPYFETLPTGIYAGDYTVFAKVRGDANHTDSEVKEIEVTIDVNTVTNPKVELSSASFRYNGSEQKPTITVKDDKGNVILENEYEVTYERVMDDDAETTEPELTEPEPVKTIDVGSYKITIKSKEGGNYSFAAYGTFTITPLDQESLTITGKPSIVYYGDTIQLSTAGGSGNGTVEWSVVSGSATPKGGGQFQITGAGSITVKAARKSGTDNYAPAEDTWQFYAYPANAKLATEPKPATGLTYTGSAQTLLITGATTVNDIGTVKYSLDKESGYEETIPTATKAGTYKVWYKVEDDANGNWTGTAPAYVEVTIARKEVKTGDLTVAWDESVAEVEGVKIAVTYADDDGTMKTISRSEYTVKVNTSDWEEKEWITVEVTAKEDGNYKFNLTALIKHTPSGGEYNDSDDLDDPGGGDGPSIGDPVRPGDGPGIEETASTQTTVRGGTASTVVSAAAGNQLANDAVANRSENVVIKPEITGDVTKAEVSLPASAVSRIGSETDASLTVSTPIADVTIPNGALSALSGAGGTVSVAAEQVDNTVVLTLTAGGRDVGGLPGGLTLTVPTEGAGPGTVAVLVYADGTREIIRKSVADDGGVRIPLDGSATVELVDNSREFEDVSAESWAADAVAFASAHEMFNGTSATTFSPELSMSRAMLTTVLYNLESNPETAFNGVFADVEGDTWYAESVSWAASCGIAAGYGNGSFGANDPITREQLAVMLWRYAGSPTADGQALDFTDAGQASGYAMEALAWAAANGILNGHGDGRIDPTGLATRAQAAQMLKNFMENT